MATPKHHNQALARCGMTENHMIDDGLLNLSLAQVLHHMVHGSGRSWEEVGAAMGWSPSVMSRIRNAEDSYFPSLPNLPTLCVVTRSTLILDWVRV